MIKRVLIFISSILIIASSTVAKDVAGGEDYPLVGRYDGSVMTLYKVSDYEEQRILTKAITSADRRETGKRVNEENSVAASGRSVRIRYEGPQGRSPLEVARNFQSEIKAKGFEILFECKGADCSDLGGSELYFALHDESPLGNGDIHSNPGSQVFTAAKLARAEGDVYVTIYVGDFRQAPEVLIDVVETAPMDTDKIVFVDAAQMQKDITAYGRVALYGILFDFDQATIRPDSKPTLDEIVKFLTGNPEVKVIVAGHTDWKGGFDYNIDLSKRRAEAVVSALAGMGIEASRLRPFGAGPAAPVASNESEAGRAKNRRVELVKAE
jgi:outer membrane protein OmpA-like peptidoglycan-associated protein